MAQHEHPNVALLRKGLEAFQKGDLDTVRQFLDPNVIWHTPGRNPLSGDYKGADEVLAFFGRLLQETEGTFKIEIHDTLANDQHGVQLTRNSAQRKGKSLAVNVVNVFHISNGKVTEAWIHNDDQYAVDEIMS
jgi:ketosteroid isomerase-like protein